LRQRVRQPAGARLRRVARRAHAARAAPAYAPKLNAAEYVFGYAKQPELANLCAGTIDEVRHYATRRLKSIQRRPTLITAFWQQAELAI